MSEPLPQRSVRVSSLELFFDLVFVFTVTQLTGLLVDGHDLEALAQVVVMLALIWWMYDGYAWLTNAIATERVRFRLLLLGGMGGFLVIALAVPHAFAHDGLAFGLAYLFVVLLHSGMYARGTSVEEMRAILRLAPFNLIGAVLITAGGALGGTAQWVLWTGAAVMLWASPRFTSVEGFVVSVAHFVERHGLVVIIAVGESVVVIGAGAKGQDLDARLILVALLSLGLNAALWWVYFSDETAVEEAFHETPAEQRAARALSGFGYWHFGILLGIVGVAAGLKKSLGHPYGELDALPAIALATGVALFIVCDIGFRRVFGLARNRIRLLAALLALLTVPLGSELGAAAEVAALATILTAALIREAKFLTSP